MSCEVVFSAGAAADLERLFDFLLERELDSATGDTELPQRAIDAIRRALTLLEHSPFTCRKAGADPFLRELVIPFGHTGDVALFEIIGADKVVIGAVRHQREDDFH